MEKIFERAMSIFQEKKENEDNISFANGEFGEMTPERALAIFYGGVTLFGTFLYFVFFKLIFLLFPMLVGVLQLVCAFTGICPVKKIVTAVMMKKNEEE